MVAKFVSDLAAVCRTDAPPKRVDRSINVILRPLARRDPYVWLEIASAYADLRRMRSARAYLDRAIRRAGPGWVRDEALRRLFEHYRADVAGAARLVEEA